MAFTHLQFWCCPSGLDLGVNILVLFTSMLLFHFFRICTSMFHQFFLFVMTSVQAPDDVDVRVTGATRRSDACLRSRAAARSPASGARSTVANVPTVLQRCLLLIMDKMETLALGVKVFALHCYQSYTRDSARNTCGTCEKNGTGDVQTDRLFAQRFAVTSAIYLQIAGVMRKQLIRLRGIVGHRSIILLTGPIVFCVKLQKSERRPITNMRNYTIVFKTKL